MQAQHSEAVIQLDELRSQCADLKAKLESGSRSNLSMKSDLAKLESQLEHSEMARSVLEKECMALREHTNHNTTLIQSECSQMQVGRALSGLKRSKCSKKISLE